ncbi:AbrB/MazE/SpoVT family DNA-binding domain-containing protein [bacterium]|nr:AbrB/MazE/SpoVT family DNA-binding domain-containing protein [bacterium]
MKPKLSLEDFFYGTATVGERGQVVIPAEVRKKFNINPGDKVLVMAHPTASGVVLCKIDGMREMLSSLLADVERLESKVAEDNE